MYKLLINGGNPLNGEIHIQGSKNAVLPILAATVLTNENCLIHNCPDISDTLSALDILRSIGCRAEFSKGTASIYAHKIDKTVVSKSLMQKMRSSVMFMGAILARGGEVVLYRPGGCRLGERPIDMHICSLTKLGAEIYECGDSLCCRLNKARSGDITLLYPSVGATENIMLMCAGRDCEVRIFNPAREPEISELQNFLNLMGANISGAGSDTILIKKSNGLHGCSYSVVSDRIVAATYACMTAICGGEVKLSGIPFEHIRVPLSALSDAGCDICEIENNILVKSNQRLSSVSRIKTLPYPGFPTDIQPMLTSVLSKAKGVSYIDETIFENRFSFVPELVKMGADITQTSSSLEICGRPAMKGASVCAKDLRGGAALITAALAANGKSEIDGLCFVDRGYEKIEKVLTSVGADIVRVEFPLPS